MSDNNNGPAYPALVRGWDNDERTYFYTTEGGMSDRDYFAARALPYVQSNEDFSLKQCCDVLGMSPADYEWTEHFPKFCARMAYKFADAMLAERGA